VGRIWLRRYGEVRTYSPEKARRFLVANACWPIQMSSDVLLQSFVDLRPGHSSVGLANLKLLIYLHLIRKPAPAIAAPESRKLDICHGCHISGGETARGSRQEKFTTFDVCADRSHGEPESH
jgi:hypothetical protein